LLSALVAVVSSSSSSEIVFVAVKIVVNNHLYVRKRVLDVWFPSLGADSLEAVVAAVKVTESVSIFARVVAILTNKIVPAYIACCGLTSQVGSAHSWHVATHKGFAIVAANKTLDRNSSTWCSNWVRLLCLYSAASLADIVVAI
jgi:hypothetical protein